MTNYFITIRASIRTRKGPLVPCDLFFDQASLEKYSISTRLCIIGTAYLSSAGGFPDLEELACRIHNDTGLDLVIRTIEVIEPPQEEEE